MDVRDRIAAMEAALKSEGRTVAQVLRIAEAGTSTWLRWRAGAPATGKTWDKIEAAFVQVCPKAELPWKHAA